MTMDYLVTQIMDHGEGNYRDWYDFVWNRTRGIRKVGILVLFLLMLLFKNINWLTDKTDWFKIFNVC